MKQLFFTLMLILSIVSTSFATSNFELSFLDNTAFRVYCRVSLLLNQDRTRCVVPSRSTVPDVALVQISGVNGSRVPDTVVSIQDLNILPQVSFGSQSQDRPAVIVERIIEQPVERVVYIAGQPGPQGPAGPQGLPGTTGINGAFNGINMPMLGGGGSIGAQVITSSQPGPQGPSGPQGDPGTTTVVYTIATSTGDVVATGTIDTQNLIFVNASGTNATTTTLFSNILTVISGFFSDIFAINATTTNLTVANLNVQNSLSVSDNIIASNIGGSSATSSVIGNNTLTTSGTDLVSNVNGVTSTTSLAGLVASSTTNAATTTGNTLTTTVNGVIASTDVITSNTVSSSGNLFSTVVNGIASVAANIINSFSQTLSGNVLTTTINGVSATSSVIGNNTLTYSTSTGILLSSVNGVVGTTTLSLANIPGLANLTSQVTGVLSVANGGTGTSTLSTSVIPEGLNLYFTGARAIGSVLTGFVAASGTVVATDSIFEALQKVQGANNEQDIALNSRLISATGTLGEIVRSGDLQNPIFSLANTGVSSGTYGSSTTIPVLTVDAFGRITAVSATSTPFALASQAFLQNGNSFGTTAVLGTNDNQDLVFRTNGAERARIGTNGNFSIGTSTLSRPLTVVGTVGGTLAVFVNQNPGAPAGASMVGRRSDGSETTRMGWFLNPNSAGDDRLAVHAVGTGDLWSFTRAGDLVGSLGAAFDQRNASTTARLMILARDNRPIGLFRNATTTLIRIENTAGLLQQRYDIGTDANTGLFRITNVNASTTSFVINESGNIGLGTTTPSERLSVVGNIRLSGALMPNGLAGATGTVLISQGSGLSPIWVSTSTLIATTENVLSFATSAGILTSTVNGVVATTTIDRLTTLNGQTGLIQTFATSTTGTDFSITSSGNVHTFNLPSASAVNRGALTSADWTTFNNKLSTATGTAGQIIRTGDAQNPVFALAPTGVMASSYGSSTTIPVLTVDAFGRITAVSATSTPFALASQAFLQGGNSFATTAVLGTNDNQDLVFRTNGIERARFGANGNFSIGTTTTSRARLDVIGTAIFQPQNITPSQIYAEFYQARQGPDGFAMRVVDPVNDPSGKIVFGYSVGRLGFGSGLMSQGLINTKIEFRGSTLANTLWIDSVSGSGVMFGENDSSNHNYLNLYHTSQNADEDTFYFTTGKIANASFRPRLEMGARTFAWRSGVNGASPFSNPITFQINETGSALFTSPVSSSTPLNVRGATGQLFNLQEWQNGLGVGLSAIDNLGRLTIGTSTNFANVDLLIATATSTGDIIKVASGTTNILRIQNDSSLALDKGKVTIGQGGISPAKPEGLARDQLYVFGRVNYSWNAFYEDFLVRRQNGATTNDGLFNASLWFDDVTGGGATTGWQADIASLAGLSGVARLSSQTTGTDFSARLTSNITTTQRSLNPVFEARISGTTNTNHRIMAGFSNATVGSTWTADSTYSGTTDGAFFRKNTTSGVWQTVTRASGVETVNNTTVSTDQYRTLRIEMNDSIPEVRFYIDGVLQFTHTTNLPGATTRLGFEVGTAMEATTAGLTVDIDYIRVWSDDPETAVTESEVIDQALAMLSETEKAEHELQKYLTTSAQNSQNMIYGLQYAVSLATTSSSTVATGVDMSVDQIGARFVALIKSALEKLSNVFIDMTAWVKELRTDRVETKLLCIEDVCVTKDQLQHLLQNTNTSAPSASSASIPESIVVDNSLSTSSTTIVTPDILEQGESPAESSSGVSLSGVQTQDEPTAITQEISSGDEQSETITP